MMISLSACNEEDKKVVIDANICCSSDLLEFVTPVVTIQGDNGEKEPFKLSKEHFKKGPTLNLTVNTTVTINGVPSNTVTTLTYCECVATSEKKFEDVKAMKGNITVKYERNSYADTSKDKYVFSKGNELGYTSKVIIDGVEHEGPKASYSITSEVVDKDEVEKYITDLCATERTISFDVK